MVYYLNCLICIKLLKGLLRRKKIMFTEFSFLEYLRTRRIMVLSLKQKKKRINEIKKNKCTCHHYVNDDHWRKNCKEYLATINIINLLKFLLYVYLWLKTIFLLHLVVLRYLVPNMFLTFVIKDYIKTKWIYKLEME